MNARFTCVLALVASAACNTRGSTFPDPIPVTDAQPPAVGSNVLSGVVRTSAKVPIAGATVFIVDESGASVAVWSAITDSTGSYRIERLPFSPSYGTLIGVSASGFFADHKWIFLVPDTRLDFMLAALEFISIGATIHGHIEDTMCAGLGYGGGFGAPCQRFALTAPASGTLEMTVRATGFFEFDFDIVRPDGTFAIYRASARSPVDFQIPIDAGVTYQIRVVAISPARDFELTTSLR